MGVDAIAKGQRFPLTSGQLFELRLNSLAATVASTNVEATCGQYQKKLCDASEWQTANAVACQFGGVAVAIGIVFKIAFTETIAHDAGLSASARAEMDIFNRYARSTINVQPGKAGNFYYQSKTVSLGGSFLEQYTNGAFDEQIRAVLETCTASRITNDRTAVTTGSGVFSCPDNAMDVETRSLLPDLGMRIVACGGTDITSPEDGTPLVDCIPFLFTEDGSPSGVGGAGISLQDAFATEQFWQFTIKIVYDAGIRSANSSLTGGTVTITPSLIYRIDRGKPKYGAAWTRLTNVTTLNGGTATVIPGGTVSNHNFVGWMPDIYGEAGDTVGTVDNSNYVFQEFEDGSGIAGKIRIVPPNVPPSAFQTQGEYLRIGREGGHDTFPLGNNVNAAYGDEPIRAWNALHQYLAETRAFGKSKQRLELPYLTSKGASTATTSFVTRGNVAKYGASWGGGNVISTISAPRGDSSYPMGLGGFLLYPIAWVDRSVKGFMGVEVRAADDMAGLVVQNILNFPSPRTPWNSSNASNGKGITVWKSLGVSYADVGLTPCDTQNLSQVPAVPNENSPAAAKGITLTTTFTPKVEVMGLKPGKPTVL